LNEAVAKFDLTDGLHPSVFN